MHTTLETPVRSDAQDGVSSRETQPPDAAQKQDQPAGMGEVDHLTGVWNRAHFSAVLEENMLQLQAGELDSVCAIFADLDRFKQVNDTLGHAIGDDLLRLVSKRIMNEIGSGGVLARLGGDEFGIVLAPAPDRQTLTTLAQRLIDLVQRTYLIEGHVIHVGASLGIAIAPQDGNSYKELLRRSDLALYAAKAAGRGTWRFFKPELEDAANDRRSNEMSLRKSLVLRQMVLFYQPQHNVETGEVTTIKVQLNWLHPQRGLLAPSEFMPLAEEIGMAVPIGEWMLKTICLEARKWPQSLVFATPITAQQFEAPGFIASVSQALTKADLPGKRLEIEVTEDVLLRNHPCVPETLKVLGDLGVGVTLDDFGTGVASLSQLAKLPFDKIKIGRSLIDAQQSTTRQRAIVRAISALGESLGVKTHAEGVTSRAHLDQVRSNGCESVQGFFCSAAVPADKLTGLLQNVGELTESRGDV